MKLTWVQKVFCDNVHKNHLQQKKISLGFTLQHKLGIEKNNKVSKSKSYFNFIIIIIKLLT